MFITSVLIITYYDIIYFLLFYVSLVIFFFLPNIYIYVHNN